jgi:hypothetical protein
MRKMALGIVVMVGVILVAAAVFGQTNLTVVRHSDNTLWVMNCEGTSVCSSWTQIQGRFSVQPTLTWDPSIQKYILIGIGNDKTSIWRSTFEADGTWNDDWELIPGASPSPVAVAGGRLKGYFKNVAVVAPSGGDYTDPATAMAAYSSWCGTPSETNPCLLKVMPGVYDIGTSTVVMQPYIDIEGSGQKGTVITGTVGGGVYPPPNGVVNGANNAEIRFLTVKRTGSGDYGAAILNTSASPAMTNVTAAASGGTIYNYCVFNNTSSSPTMTNVTATASAGNLTNNFGVYNYNSSPTMTNVTATASGGTYTINSGVYNYNSSPMMTNVTLTASGGTSSNNYGVRNESSSPTMTNVTATGKSGTSNYGLHVQTSGTLLIDRSTFNGSTNSILNGTGCTVNIGGSKLVSAAKIGGGTYNCVLVYKYIGGVLSEANGTCD